MMSSTVTGLGRVISHHTVHCQSQQHGIRAYRPFTGMTLMRQHRNWQRVLFCDESRFQLFRVDCKTRIYQRALCCVQEIVPFGGVSVMVWGSICGQQWTDLTVTDGNLTAHRYINQVLRPVLLPFLQHQPRFSFQEDNARPHSSCGAAVLYSKRQCFAMASPFT